MPDERPTEGSDAGLAEARRARHEHGQVLVAAVVAALPGWVERCVAARLPPGRRDGDEVRMMVATAVSDAVEEGRPRLEAAVEREPGVERGPAPLQVLRSLVRFPTEVLRALDVPEVRRGDFEIQAFPEDVYDLSPATWSDVDPTLHEPGLTWGAATAHVHRQRSRSAPP